MPAGNTDLEKLISVKSSFWKLVIRRIRFDKFFFRVKSHYVKCSFGKLDLKKCPHFGNTLERKQIRTILNHTIGTVWVWHYCKCVYARPVRTWSDMRRTEQNFMRSYIKSPVRCRDDRIGKIAVRAEHAQDNARFDELTTIGSGQRNAWSCLAYMSRVVCAVHAGVLRQFSAVRCGADLRVCSSVFPA